MPMLIDLFLQAQLSQAAYAENLYSGMPDEDYQDALTGRGMSPTQATIFAKQFKVAAQFADMFTGFSATVFDRNGVKYFAIRGTEGLFSFASAADWLTNVNGIGDEGIAVDQGLALVNYLQRLYAPNGAPVVQYTYNSTLKTIGTALGTGLGLLTGQPPLTVTGHSLGGHLAMIMGRAAPEIVSSVYTFNAPGFDTIWSSIPFPLTSDGFFKALRNTGIAPETGPIGTSWNGQIMTHVAVEGDDVHGVGNVPGMTAQRVFAESINQGPIGAHFVGPIADSLALHVLLSEVDPGLNTLVPSEGIAKIYSFLTAASNDPGRSLEETLDALRRLFRSFGQPIPAATPTGDREQLYLNLYETEFRQRIASYSGVLSMEPLAGVPVETLTALASDPSSIAYRYALKELNPFVVTGDDSIYAPHNANGDLDLYISATITPAGMTGKYIDDRAAFLYWKTVASIADESTQTDSNASEKWRYVDASQTYAITVFGSGDIAGATPRYAAFGADRSDVIQGDVRPDSLYGGLGADLLQGRGGDDCLEGGAGNDVYQYTASKSLTGVLVNDGADDILDTDGKGLVRYTFTEKNLLSPDTVRSSVLAGIGIRTGASQWQSPDGQFTYTQQAAGLKASVNGDSGGSVFILDFDYAKAAQDGFLGIRLVDEGIEPIAAVRTFYGDKADWDADGDPANDPQPQPDAFGNTIRADGQDGRPDTPQPNRADVFFGSAADEVERFETAGGDDVVKADGPDSATSTAGGRDVILAGAGRDVVEAGAADDWIEGGADDDLLGGGYGDDVIWADAGQINGVPVTLAQSIITGNSAVGVPGQGDLLTGDDGADRLFGAATSDLLAGGMDEDLIVGGAGDDNIYGDASIVGADFGWTAARIEAFEGGTKVYRIEATKYSPAATGPTAPGSADVIYGGAGADWIFAGAGDDYVEGGDTPGDQSFIDDVIFGEAGDDILIGGSGSDTLHGDSASVDAAGLSGDDYLDGGLGIDFLFGGGGDDILFGGDGGDVIQGNEGNDILAGERGDDLLMGGTGKDTYFYDRGHGNDTIRDPDIGADSEYLSNLVVGPGLTRADVKFRLGSLMIDFGDGDAIHVEGFDPDDPYATPVLDAIQFANGERMTFDDILAQGFDLDGTSGDDYIAGTAAIDRIDAGAGNDIVIGKAGDDIILGGDGDDEIESGEGDDVVDAGAGADVLKGGAGSDTLSGGEGDDLLIGGAGDDVLVGGAGVDSYVLVGGIGTDLVTDGEDGEVSVLDLAGLPVDALLLTREGDDLRVGLRGLDDAVVVTEYFTRAQSWTVRGAEGDIELEALVATPAPDDGDAIDTLWHDIKYAALATTLGQAYAIGWTALGQGRFEGFLESAWLDYTQQTTTTTYRRVEAPFDVLAQFTEETGGQVRVAGFGSRESTHFWYPIFTFLSGRQESDASLVSGHSATALGQAVSEGQALLSIRDRPPTLNETHTITSESGGLVSYDTGGEVLLATVTYEYDLGHWNRNAIVVDVTEAPSGWSHPLNTVAGNRVLVAEAVLDTRRLAVNEIIGGASSNTIIVPAGDLLSKLSFTTLVDAGEGDDTIFGGALAYGNAGDDAITTNGILIGGDGDDRLTGEAGARFVFTAQEYGTDTLEANAVASRAYLEWYYGGLGIGNWERRLNHGGEYHLDPFEGEGWYFPTLEQAEAWRDNFGYGEISFVAPLPSKPAVATRNDLATLDALETAGVLSREVVEFTAGLSLVDLSLVVRVAGASADAHPAQPWHDGGTLSVRWNEGEAGFDVEIPDINYGLIGADLFARIGENEDGEPLYAWETYRLGEGIEAFRFADGSEYSLEEMLARATVIPEYGDYFFQRGAGTQTISRFSAAIVFEPGISYGELEFARDGLDLVFTLADGSGQGRIPEWYADSELRPGLELRFDDGVVIDEEALSWQGLFVVGTEGDDVLIGIDGFGDWLDADLGDDIVDGGSGNDNVFGGEGNDIVRGGAGGDDVETWGEGNNFLDAGPGDDYVYTESPTLVIGGTGDDWIDFYGDGGIVAFNPGDGHDTVYVAGTLTLSLGGGIAPEDLELELVDSDYVPGVNDLLLAVGEEDAIRLTRQWEDDPGAWPAVTLQLFGSVHRFDFNAMIDALVAQSAGQPGFVLHLGGLLEAARIDFSATDGIGGALAWQYATTGSVAALSDEDIRSLIVDPAFGFAPQSIELEPVNRAPVVADAIADQIALEDSAFELSVANAFADPDAGDALTFSVAISDGSSLPAWLAFDAASATLSGTAANDDVGLLGVTVTATDIEGEKVSDTFSLEVANVNDPPLAADDIGAAQEDGGPVTLGATALLANDVDVDAGDSLAIVAVTDSASGAAVTLVGGDVTYDPGAQFQSLGAGATLIDHFDYTVADQAGETSTARVAMTVTGVNDAPVLIEPIAPQAGRVGEAFEFSLGGAFADVDTGDSLAYGATLADGAALPEWLAFDAQTASFSGTPAAGAHGGYAVRVTATDAAGATAEATFTLDIQAPPPADPGGDGKPGGWHHGHDHDGHPGRGKGHHQHNKHDKHDPDRRGDGNHGRDWLHDRKSKPPKFDFDALLEHFERDERRTRRSQLDIQRGWQKVARYAARVGAGDEDAVQGLHWLAGKDVARMVSGSGHAFGFEGSTGAARGGDDFKCFEGLREGFRRL